MPFRQNNGTFYDGTAARNKLVTNWIPSTWKSEFVYDGQRRLRIARDYGWQSGAWVKTNEVRLIYDGVVVVQERDTNNAPMISYTRSGTYLLARSDNALSSHAYYHSDGNRNVTTLINVNQLIVAKYLYHPFGNTLTMNGPMAEANLYRFAGQRYHGNSGMVLYPRRAYAPGLQGFVNRDPINEAGGINLYGFVGNNPISFYDPLGLDPSMSGLFWQNVYDNGMSDAGRYFNRLGQTAVNTVEGLAKTAYRAQTDPLGLAYDQYQGVANLGGFLGKLSADPCERQRALNGLNAYASTPEAYADAAFFIDSILAGGLLAPEAGAGKLASTDFVAGRLGGELYDAGKLAQLEGYLGRRGMTLRVGDEFLPAGKAGGFNATEKTLSLRSNPTQYEVWHELSHARQFGQLGADAYKAQSVVQKEQFVYDMLNNSTKRWNSLNFGQQQHAINYILEKGGIR